MKRKKLEKRVLAEGESTGHSHRVDIDVFEDDSGTRHFEGETEVKHQEHKVIPLKKKKWASARKQEYDHFAEEAKTVRD
jgi:hypothetical protein